MPPEQARSAPSFPGNLPGGLSIILPAFNEALAIGGVVGALRQAFPEAEILVVDDASTDGTGPLAAAAGARVVRHPRNLGNGASVKTGARQARGEILVFMDADGQHRAADIPGLIALLGEGYELAVGARQADSHASRSRLLGNRLLNRVASLLTGHPIADLTSGFRAMRADTFRGFLFLLPNGFSYPTSSTMAYLRSGHPVGYLPIRAGRRRGQSKIRLLRDGMRFLLIIVKIITLFSPARVFVPSSLLLFLLGLLRYLQTYFHEGRLTNMSVILFVASLLTFLIGLVSEQITSLHLGTSLALGSTNVREIPAATGSVRDRESPNPGDGTNPGTPL
ncbi:MAG: glycosyltransferase family 2 protein [Magnetococcales bacterium]|nr:glycosyltransferase family 2 protein [Magnetococcales bacterium]